jgi:hypothetical protein
MDNNLTDRISALPSLNKDQLLILWRENFSRTPPSKLRKELMVPTLAYRMQEKEYGGLSHSARKRLRDIAKSDLVRKAATARDSAQFRAGHPPASILARRSARGRRDRYRLCVPRIYSITEKGKQSLKQWFRLPVVTRTHDNEMLLKLFFGSMMLSGESHLFVKAHRDHHVALLEKFEAIERSISTGPNTEERTVYLRATLSYGQSISRALIQWSDATERALRALES